MCLSLRRALRRRGHVVVYLVVVSDAGEQWTRREPCMTLTAARNTARRARARGHVAAVTLELLTAVADVEVPS